MNIIDGAYAFCHPVEILYIDTAPYGEGDIENYLPLLRDWAAAEVLRFNNLRGRKHCLFSRLLLQDVYGADFRLKKNEWGKPYLDSPRGAAYPYFSISHSRDICACAFSKCEAGFDAEYMRERGSQAAVAERFFNAEEAAFVKTSARAESAFYRVWCRKEAFLKAAGRGLNADMPAFSVLRPRCEAPFFTGFLLDVELREGYAAALCTASPLAAEDVRAREVEAPRPCFL